MTSSRGEARWVLAMPGAEDLAEPMAVALGEALHRPRIRRFPDGESYVRIEGPCAAATVTVVARLHDPDPKFVPFALAASALKDLGARRICLVAPYLPYMRQDARFQPGEAVSARYFSAMLSPLIDALVTVDPHLHRIDDLARLYPVRCRVVHAAALLAERLRHEVAEPLLIGPDEESEQWVSALGERIGAPVVVLSKIRRGDRDVEIALPPMARWRGRTPVLVDDIISTGHTMTQAIAALAEAGWPAPVCMGIHGLFADDALRRLRAAGAAGIITTNTVDHETNAVDLSGLLASAVADILES